MEEEMEELSIEGLANHEVRGPAPQHPVEMDSRTLSGRLMLSGTTP